MLKLVDIYRKDRNTRQESRVGRLKRRCLVVITVVILATLFCDISMDFLASVLAVQSILAGFGFNVLVYLTTNRPIPVPPSAKIERRLKINRVNNLGREIFYNISYFNTVALVCIATALTMAIIISFDRGNIATWWNNHYVLNDFGESLASAVKLIGPRLLAAFLYVLLVESLLSFMRLIRRSTYYFEQKIALSDNDGDS